MGKAGTMLYGNRRFVMSVASMRGDVSVRSLSRKRGVALWVILLFGIGVAISSSPAEAQSISSSVSKTGGVFTYSYTLDFGGGDFVSEFYVSTPVSASFLSNVVVPNTSWTGAIYDVGTGPYSSMGTSYVRWTQSSSFVSGSLSFSFDSTIGPGSTNHTTTQGAEGWYIDATSFSGVSTPVATPVSEPGVLLLMIGMFVMFVGQRAMSGMMLARGECT